MAGPILCGIDGSTEAQGAARLAAGLCRALDRRLVLVHAVEGRSKLRPASHRVRPALTAQARQMLDHTARQVQAPGDMGRIARTGDPAQELLSLAAGEHAAILVVGSRGRGAVGAMLGSVSRRVAAEAGCPVLIARGIPEGREGPFVPDGRPIVCGIDGSPASLTAVGVAGRIAAAMKAGLVLAHAFNVAVGGTFPHHAVNFEPMLNAERRRRLRMLQRARWRTPKEVTSKAVISGGGPLLALKAVVQEESAGMIAVGSRGRGPVRGAVLGSTSMGLASSADVPVLLIPPGATDEHAVKPNWHREAHSLPR